MPCPDHPAARHLLSFSRQTLDQALALVAAHTGPARPEYAGPVGSHLRHVIEHFEALIAAPPGGCVDYDARARDATLDACCTVARARLLALRRQLSTWDEAALAAPVQVLGQCGLAGEFRFAVASSVGRELAFVASHAVHHFALLKPHCLASGIAIDGDFGKAPATVAHERARTAAAPFVPPTRHAKETPCTSPQPFA
ncbi:hypothetical protein BurJ1DRAFT_3413 [Burkholderiales bacterium JOSHI_001]|nr:hypothetical protein BurJ1DRAFT_3413 [Burkholderiales bacterium JOSHI_001]